MQGCSPDVTQSALGVGAGLFSRADSHADPQDCTLITLMNSMIESCAYESARQVRGLMVQKKLPGFALSDVKFHDYTPQECSLLRAPAPVPAPPVVNYISAAPLPAPNCEATPITSPAKVSAPQRRAKKAAVVRRSCP